MKREETDKDQTTERKNSERKPLEKREIEQKPSLVVCESRDDSTPGSAQDVKTQVDNQQEKHTTEIKTAPPTSLKPEEDKRINRKSIESKLMEKRGIKHKPSVVDEDATPGSAQDVQTQVNNQQEKHTTESLEPEETDEDKTINRKSNQGKPLEKRDKEQQQAQADVDKDVCASDDDATPGLAQTNNQQDKHTMETHRAPCTSVKTEEDEKKNKQGKPLEKTDIEHKPTPFDVNKDDCASGDDATPGLALDVQTQVKNQQEKHIKEIKTAPCTRLKPEEEQKKNKQGKRLEKTDTEHKPSLVDVHKDVCVSSDDDVQTQVDNQHDKRTIEIQTAPCTSLKPEETDEELTTNRKSSDGKPLENRDVEHKPSQADVHKDVCASGDGATSGSPEDVQTRAKNRHDGPKYRTINYGDSFVKKKYKPKIIRFTDTFTF
ncbi:hypothetical protein NQD34_002122 [Periophthalmus magnuspinnatus]|nr:hypothetical protein NQD34_002122 [Periophthalmus magnuspinnatus]